MRDLAYGFDPRGGGAAGASGFEIRSSTHHCAKDMVPLIFDSRSA